MATKRFYGWKRQAPDSRDRQFAVPKRVLAALPPVLNLTANMGPQLNQADLGSCGPNSVAEQIDYDHKVEGKPFLPPSRLFIYYNTRVIMGTVGQDSGVDNRSMLQALAQSGYCSEASWPYHEDVFTERPPQACYAAALANRISEYLAVAVTAQAGRACLATGRTWLWGGQVFSQIESDQAAANGILTMPSGEAVGGHDLTVCGATLIEQPGQLPGNVWPAGTLKLRNHWVNSDGAPWGDGGYAYMPFDYAFNAQLCSDFWTITQAP